MAKNDYFVLVYKILKYLYKCLKESQPVDRECLQYGTKDLPIDEVYWEYIFEHIAKDGYVEGVTVSEFINGEKSIKITKYIRITPKGIEYLEENSMMKKAAEAVKDFTSMAAGLI